MARNKILMAMVAADILFLLFGAVELGFAMIVKGVMNEAPVEGEQATRNLLFRSFPLEAGIANAVLVFITFLITIPGILTPARGWLKVGGYMVTICGFFTLCIGVYLWVLTLRTKDRFAQIWVSEGEAVQTLMQTSFSCCGYLNSTSPAFITNPTCPSPAAAALMRGCSAPITTFANVFLDDIFTAVFGMVGADALLILTIACLLKDRKERERYQYIDKKSGYTGF